MAWRLKKPEFTNRFKLVTRHHGRRRATPWELVLLVGGCAILGALSGIVGAWVLVVSNVVDGPDFMTELYQTPAMPPIFKAVVAVSGILGALFGLAVAIRGIIETRSEPTPEVPTILRD